MGEIVSLFGNLLLFLVLLSATIASAVSAVITVVPDESASKACMLGYKAHCSFTPIGTIILVIVAVGFGFVFMKMYGNKIRASLFHESLS